MADEPEILSEVRGRVGILTLNRPAALNALTLGMVRLMREALDGWAGRDEVAAVLVRGAGGRGFCAGGDIQELYRLGQAGHTAEQLAFWAEEYDLDRVIKRYPKPYVTLIDGIVMGGGVGVSLHGSHRIAGERFQFAMPEVGIGFFPDVGATFALPRLPWKSGHWLALTGERIGRDDAAALGIATHCVPAARFDALTDALAAGDEPPRALARYAVAAGEAPVLAHARVIATSFAPDGVEAILAALDRAAGEGSAVAGKAAAAMRTKSPTSLKLAQAQLRRGAALDFEDAMRLEYRIVSRIIATHDLYEGIRAQVIDKDRNPRWNPASLEDVSDDSVERFFDDLGPDEIVFRDIAG